MLEYNLDCNLNFIIPPDGLSFTKGTKGEMIGQTTGGNAGVENSLNCWGYWQDYHYPTVIRESYPVYLQDRAKDKGKQAFEIIKMLKDKKIVKLKTVSEFIDAMDTLIKIL